MSTFDRVVRGEIAEVRRSGGELHVDWRIPRFLHLPWGLYDHYESPPFGFLDARWYLSVYPDWESSGGVSLFLCRDDADAHPSAGGVTVTVGVRGSGGGLEWRRGEEERELEVSDGLLYKLCTRSELVEQKERLVPGGALTIVCQMRVPGTDAAGQQSVDDIIG